MLFFSIFEFFKAHFSTKLSKRFQQNLLILALPLNTQTYFSPMQVLQPTSGIFTIIRRSLVLPQRP